MKYLLTLFFCSISFFASAQVSGTKYDRIGPIGGGIRLNTLVSLPVGYNDPENALKRYPAFIMIPGNGQTDFADGTYDNHSAADSAKLREFGPHFRLTNGQWNGLVTHPVTGEPTPMILISIQQRGEWTPGGYFAPRLDSLMLKYRIDTFSVFLSGISGGGSAVNDISIAAAQSYKYAGYMPVDWAAPHEVRRVGQNNLWWWGIAGDGDAARVAMQANRDTVNNWAPGHAFFSNYTGNHCCWNVVYDTAYKRTIDGVSMNIYQYALTKKRPGAWNYWENVLAVTAGTTKYTAYSYSNTPSKFVLDGRNSSGPVTSYSWVKISGQDVTIDSADKAFTTVSHSNEEGYIQFELTVSDGSVTNKDTVTVWVRDLMKKNKSASGPGRKFYLGNTPIPGVISPGVINAGYVNRDNIFGTQIVGKDTIVLMPNPNHADGLWERVNLGDFGGNETDPVVVMADSVFAIGINGIGGAFCLGNIWGGSTAFDSAVVCYVKVDGLANRESKGVTYGLQFGRSMNSISEPVGLHGGMYINLAHHVELCGIAIANAGHGIQFKVNSGLDSTNPFRLYDNFRIQNVHAHDLHFYRTGYEAFYFGNTDPAGNIQLPNDGPPPIGDSLLIERIVLNEIGQDGVQIGNWWGPVVVRDVVAYKTGHRRVGSHHWSILIGGYVQGEVYDNVVVNAAGPMGSLGKGINKFYRNIIDSVSFAPAAVESGMYFNQPNPYPQIPTPDSLQIDIHNNLFNRTLFLAIHSANYSGRQKRGAIRNNVFVDPSRSIGQLVYTDASDTVENNTLLTSIIIDTTELAGELPAWEVYKLLRATPPADLISFFDDAPENQLPVAVVGGPQTIYPPVSSVNLIGEASYDSDGTIVSYSWTKISGPDGVSIVSPTSANTTVSDLSLGVFVFRLTVTDNDAATGHADVQITVAEAPQERGLRKYIIIKGVQ